MLVDGDISGYKRTISPGHTKLMSTVEEYEAVGEGRLLEFVFVDSRNVQAEFVVRAINSDNFGHTDVKGACICL